jgi:hypothetical protein
MTDPTFRLQPNSWPYTHSSAKQAGSRRRRRQATARRNRDR